MSKSTRNSGKTWTQSEIDRLRELARKNTPTRVMGIKLGRTESAIYTKASDEKISLNPHNVPPYNRR